MPDQNESSMASASAAAEGAEPSPQSESLVTEVPTHREHYETLFWRGDEAVCVSTIESKGGSRPLGVPDDYWCGETCGWIVDPKTRKRGQMVFGPDYHREDLMERHIEAIRAVMAGYAYIALHTESEVDPDA